MLIQAIKTYWPCCVVNLYLALPELARVLMLQGEHTSTFHCKLFLSVASVPFSVIITLLPPRLLFEAVTPSCCLGDKVVAKFGRKTILLSCVSMKNVFCSSNLF